MLPRDISVHIAQCPVISGEAPGNDAVQGTISDASVCQVQLADLSKLILRAGACRMSKRMAVCILDPSDARARNFAARVGSEMFDVSITSVSDIVHALAVPPACLVVADTDCAIGDAFVHLARAGLDIPVCAYSERLQMQRVVAAVRMGVVDYFVFTEDSLFDARLHRASMRGGVDPFQRADIETVRSRARDLTEREAEVAGLMVRGMSNREITLKMGISVRTIEVHCASVIKKLGFSRTRLAYLHEGLMDLKDTTLSRRS